MEAIKEFQRMGFRLWIDGENIRYRYEKTDPPPDPDHFETLLKTIKSHKNAAFVYLQTIKNDLAETPIEITLTDKIVFRKSEIPKNILNNIRAYLTFTNPKYADAEERGYWTGDMPEHIKAYYSDCEYLYAFRGYLGNLLRYLSSLGLKYRISDQRRLLPEIDFTFSGDLRDYQDRAVNDALQKHFGVLVAPCGSGKTVMALKIIAERRQPTIIITHTKELCNQWIDRITQYLGIPGDDIGIIGSGRESIKPVITVGMVQTLCKRDLHEISKHFGFLICDENHHAPASTFTKVVTAFDAYYMLGLSATPYRRDKLDKLIFIALGDISATVTGGDLERAEVRIKPRVIPRKTDFHFDYQEDSDYVPMISALTKDLDRNWLIVSDVMAEYHQDRNNFCLVLSDRKAHCEALADLLQKRNVPCAVLTGDLPKKERENVITDLGDGLLRVVLATGALAGEGLDVPRLNRLFVVTPIRWKGRIRQYVGRILRTSEGKKDAKIYDYVDNQVDILQNSYWSRYRNAYAQKN